MTTVTLFDVMEPPTNNQQLQQSLLLYSLIQDNDVVNNSNVGGVKLMAVRWLVQLTFKASFRLIVPVLPNPAPITFNPFSFSRFSFPFLSLSFTHPPSHSHLLSFPILLLLYLFIPSKITPTTSSANTVFGLSYGKYITV